MDNLWMTFVYPGSFLSLLGIVLLIIGYQRRRTGRRTRLEGVVAQPGRRHLEAQAPHRSSGRYGIR